MASCGVLRGPRCKAVPSGAARRRMADMKFRRISGVTSMTSIARSPITERARETSKDRLRNDHPALAACRRTRVAFVTGLRIATEAPGRGWINLFDAVLPRESVWMAHMQAAVALVAVSTRLCDLSDQIRPRAPRPAGQDPPARTFRPRQARLGAYNIVLYWVFFVTMLALIASGGLVVFRLLRRPRRGDAALVRNVGDIGLCRPSYPGALPDRRRLAVASDLSPDTASRAAAAARCDRAADVAG